MLHHNTEEKQKKEPVSAHFVTIYSYGSQPNLEFVSNFKVNLQDRNLKQYCGSMETKIRWPGTKG